MTNFAGCFNIGESDYQYHGANRFGANSLLSCIFSGLVAGVEVPRYIAALHRGNSMNRYFRRRLAIEEEIQKDLLSKDGPENVHKLHDELADWMVRYVSVKRDNPDFEKTMKRSKRFERGMKILG